MERKPRCCLCGEDFDIQDMLLQIAFLGVWITKFEIDGRTNFVHTICEAEMEEIIREDREACLGANN